MEGLGKRVKLVYDDGNRVTIKFGILKEADDDFISLEVDNGSIEIIPTQRVIRIEILQGGGEK
jgi:hypothetical protein